MIKSTNKIPFRTCFRTRNSIYLANMFDIWWFFSPHPISFPGNQKSFSRRKIRIVIAKGKMDLNNITEAIHEFIFWFADQIRKARKTAPQWNQLTRFFFQTLHTFFICPKAKSLHNQLWTSCLRWSYTQHVYVCFEFQMKKIFNIAK